MGNQVWLLCAVFLLALIHSTVSLSCFYCNGMTNYDPNDCLEPEKPNSKTFVQECKKGEYCEKKIHRVDHRQDVIARGCSSNHQGSSYFWSEDFSVYWCQENLCNSATTLSLSWKTGVMVSLAVLSLHYFR